MARLIGDGTVIEVGVEVDPKDQQIEALKAEKRRLERAVADADLRAERAREDADRALSNLRRILQPLYTGLQMVFGEFEVAGVTEAGETPPRTAGPGAAPPINPHVAAAWENWKQQLPGYPARIITALLIHKEMTTQQLAIACGCKSQRISEGIMKLNKAALINKNGRVFSLKSLG